MVRAYYRAVNRRERDAAADLYDPACVTESLFPESPADVRRGRDANREQLERFFDAFEGAFEDGSSFRVHSIAGNETGWGWVHASWMHRVRSREGGETRQFRGYTHFLVEDGLIRRQRSVAEAVAPAELAAEERVRTPRHYPSHPVVGVGGVILVSPADAERIGWSEQIEPVGVVLIKRQFEPLAGQWSLPGGALEVGETLEAGVAREMLEETGLTVDVEAIVDVFDRILVDANAQVRYHFVLIDYLCRPLSGRLAAGSDVVDVTIANPDRLEPYELTEKACDVIRRAINRARPT